MNAPGKDPASQPCMLCVFSRSVFPIQPFSIEFVRNAFRCLYFEKKKETNKKGGEERKGKDGKGKKTGREGGSQVGKKGKQREMNQPKSEVAGSEGSKAGAVDSLH